MSDQNASSFATIEDLEARYKPLGLGQKKAGILLQDASALIRDTIPTWKTTASPDSLKRITCDMVRRALSAEGILGDGLGGISQTSETAGNFSQSFTFSNPMGDLYLTKAEKRILRGISGTDAFHIDMTGDDYAPR